MYARQAGERIPNRPFFFANANVEYTVPALGGQLHFFSDTRYVGSYFLGWESQGTRNSKQVIPEQFTVNTGITYEREVGKIRWVVTIEMFNVADARVYDFF
ncbi:MAG: hypothetical protein AAGE93_02455 [Bacteroidota bacterium]